MEREQWDRLKQAKGKEWHKSQTPMSMLTGCSYKNGVMLTSNFLISCLILKIKINYTLIETFKSVKVIEIKEPRRLLEGQMLKNLIMSHQRIRKRKKVAKRKIRKKKLLIQMMKKKLMRILQSNWKFWTKTMKMRNQLLQEDLTLNSTIIITFSTSS